MKQRVILFSTAAMFLSTLAITTSAQEVEERRIERRVNINVNNRADGNTTRQIARSFVFVDDANGEVRIDQKNDDVKVTINGKKVSADRVELSDGVIRVHDEDGNVIFKHTIGELGGGAMDARLFEPNLRLPAEALVDLNRLRDVTVDRPKSRIGVMMVDLDEKAFEELSIENEEAFSISQVIDDSPAMKAGLKANDVIVRINEQSASQQLLRDLVAGSAPGTEIRLEILRKGKPKVIEITTGEPEGFPLPDGFVLEDAGGGSRVYRWRIENGNGEFVIETDSDFNFDSDMQRNFDQDSKGQIKRDRNRGGHFDVQFDWDAEGGFDVEHLHRLLMEQMRNPQVRDALLQLDEVRPLLLDAREALRDVDIQELLRDAASKIDLELDDDVRERLHEVLADAMARIHDAGERKGEAWLQLHEGAGDDVGMVIELLPLVEGGEHVLVLPRMAERHNLEDQLARPQMQQQRRLRELRLHPQAGNVSDGMQDRLNELEARLDRIERLLDRLDRKLDRSGDDDDDTGDDDLSM
ncbi:MAG: PDZ domain-containing protein [Phycisphaerales bacterium]